jgi:hypothetical protein
MALLQLVVRAKTSSCNDSPAYPTSSHLSDCPAARALEFIDRIEFQRDNLTKQTSSLPTRRPPIGCRQLLNCCQVLQLAALPADQTIANSVQQEIQNPLMCGGSGYRNDRIPFRSNSGLEQLDLLSSAITAAYRAPLVSRAPGAGRQRILVYGAWCLVGHRSKCLMLRRRLARLLKKFINHPFRLTVLVPLPQIFQ